MRTALVIKLGSTLPEIREAAGPQVEVVHVDELDAALELIRSSPVHLILLSEVTFRSPVGGFLSLLREEAPGKQVPVVVIDLMSAGGELAVYESGAAGAPARNAPLRELRVEIQRVCAAADSPSPAASFIPAGTSTHFALPSTTPPAASAHEVRVPPHPPPPGAHPPSAAELRRIGFNDCVERGTRAVHVQTEVLGGSPLRVHSTVMEGGGILDATTRSVDVAELQIDKVRDLVRSQHDSVVAEVRRGRYG
jgi:hypothetical protein